MKRMFLLLLGDEFLCITDDSPIWAIIVVVLNFANAARLIKKVPISTDDKDI